MIIWKANFSGTLEQLDEVKKKLEEIAEKNGTKVDGPYYAQDTDLMWLFWVPAGDMGLGGRDFLPWVQENNVPIEAVSWEIGVTHEEFWG